MLKTIRIVPMALAMMAVPAMASSDGFVPAPGDTGSMLEQYRYFRTEEGSIQKRAPAAYAPAQRAPASPAITGKGNGFEYVGGETGWQLIPHKLVWAAGRFAHSDECDHAVRIVKGPTAPEFDAVKKAYPAS